MVIAFIAGLLFSLFALLFAVGASESEENPEVEQLGFYLTAGSWLLSMAFFAAAVWL